MKSLLKFDVERVEKSRREALAAFDLATQQDSPDFIVLPEYEQEDTRLDSLWSHGTPEDQQVPRTVRDR